MGDPVTLVTAILARNEAGPDRYLRRVIERCKTFSDTVLLLDDGSTDDTVAVAEALGCVVYRYQADTSCMWGTEAPAREQLWNLAANLAGDGWVLVCDADMLLEGDPRPLTQSWDAAAWAFPLVDCWDSEETFRVDGPWGFGPRTPRPWLFKPSALTAAAEWSLRGVHTGHAPANFAQAGPCFATTDVYWKHLAYVTRDARVRKMEQYKSVMDQLSVFERDHALSILD